MKASSLETVRTYVDRQLALFAIDPPDTDFQRGFLEALLMVRREAFEPNPTSSE
jgi:hypothetical protein